MINKYISKLNPYFTKYYQKYEGVEHANPLNFFSSERLDVVAKIIYCEYALGIEDTIFNKVFYYLHLKKLNNFIGKDSSNYKFKDYKNKFDDLILSIKKNKFDDNISLIPVDLENKIIDGSHRLAASIVLKKKIKIIKFLSKAPHINFRMIKDKHNFKNNPFLLDYLILKFIKYNKNLRIFTLFPVRNKKFDEQCISILKKYGTIILSKKIPFIHLGNSFNLMRILYENADWIGNEHDFFKGAQWKSKTCFEKTDGNLDIILFEPKKNENASKEYLKLIKEEIRFLYKIRFHSIHSSDNHDETIRYSKLFFHYNSYSIMFKRKEQFFLNFEKKLYEIKKLNIDLNLLVFSGSSVLAAMGIRAPKDLDIFHKKDLKFPNYLSSHNSQLKYLEIKINEIIFNPKNYFFYMGLKFLHPKILLKLKENRLKIKPNSKDELDITLLKQNLN